MSLPPIFVELKANAREIGVKLGEAQEQIERAAVASEAQLKRIETVVDKMVAREAKAAEAAGRDFDAAARKTELMAERVEKAGVKVETATHRSSIIGGAALLGLGGAAYEAGKAVFEAADKQENAQAKLEQALTNTGTSYDAVRERISPLISRMDDLGFSGATTKDALAIMTTATGSAEKSMGLMSTAADLARFKNISLADASFAVARAAEGQLRPLRQLGIDLPVVAGSATSVMRAQDQLAKAQENATRVEERYAAAKHHTLANEQALVKAHEQVVTAQEHLSRAQKAGSEILAELNKRIGGQAVSASHTFAGELRALDAKTQDVEATIGTKLIPVLTHLLGGLVDVTKWVGKHKDAVIAAGLAITGVLLPSMARFATSAVVDFAEATVKVIGSLLGMTAAETAAGEASTIALGPIGLAIGALAVVAFEVYKHWNTIWPMIERIVGHFGQFVINDVLKPVVSVFFWWAETIVGEAAAAFGWVPGLGGKLKEANRAVHAMADEATATLSGFATTMGGLGQSAGQNYSDGLSSGINIGAPGAIAAASAVAHKMHESVNNALGNASPSRKARQSARDYLQGFILGVADKGPEAIGAVSGVGSAIGLAPGYGAGAGGGGGDVPLEVTLLLDGDVLYRGVQRAAARYAGRNGGVNLTTAR